MNLYFFTSNGGFQGGLLPPLDAAAALARVRRQAISPTLPRWKKDTWRTTR